MSSRQKRSNLCSRLFAISVVMVSWISLCIADTFVVINTEDSGEGSLRLAIAQANSNAGPDTIVFNIPDTDPNYHSDEGVWMIQPETHLPIVTDDGTMIEGESQTQNQGDRNSDGPEIMIDGSMLSGPSFNNGFSIESSDNIISGLIISGFPMNGIDIYGEESFSNLIWGNFIGTNASGSDTLGNGRGIYIGIDAKYNTIGGVEQEARNVISGNNNQGIEISYSDSNTVIGNFIGTNASGTLSLPNRFDGIVISGHSKGNQIGGKLTSERNIVSGNGFSGITLRDVGTRNNVVYGNYIGTDVTGIFALGNRHGIVIVEGAKANIIGGLTDGEVNVISGNTYCGMNIEYVGADSNQVLGNLIGPDANGQLFSDNQNYGIRIWHDARYNQIGPTNVIKYNGDYGIFIDGSGTLYNTITQNSIYKNGGKGISLSSGGNGGIVSPVIAGVGSVWGTTFPNATVEIFSDPLDEGMTYEATVLADESGSFTWSGTPGGPFVTATATDENGNTSEFSDPEEVIVSVPEWIVINTNDSGEGSLRWAIEQANSNTGPDTIQFNIPTEDEGFKDNVWTIKPLTDLPTITDDSTVVDGFSQTMNQGDTNPEGPEIMLDGHENSDKYNKGLLIHSADNVIKGLVISGFDRGIFVTSNSARRNKVIGNYIGTDASGSDTLGNSVGVAISAGAKNNRIGGAGTADRNIISGNSNNGISIYNAADSNTVCGNWIGLDGTGRNRIANLRGISAASGCKFNQIGPDNIISGNTSCGIELRDAGTDSNWVRGNWIGLDVTGQDTVGNLTYGIYLFDVSHNEIGGPSEEDGNVISGSGEDGLLMAYGLFNVIQNNYIGTDTSGTRDLGNLFSGIYFWGSGKRNIFCNNSISGNDSCGILITSSPEGNVFRDNKIGVQADGFSPLPNRVSGIRIQDGATADTIGPGNQIWHNGEYGVLLKDSSVTRITITQNSIAKNDSGGISLLNKANEGVSVPVIISQNPLTGTASPNSTVEIFSDSSNQGQIYEATVQVNGSGNWTCTGSISGPRVTATVTDPNGDTSEFSDGVTVTAVETADREVPERYFLSQNYPNPFNPETAIQFSVKKTCRVVLKVYDLLGREVAQVVDKQYQPGVYEVKFDATGLSSGLYFYRIQMGSFHAVRKMVVLE